jgi:hypothetical protein
MENSNIKLSILICSVDTEDRQENLKKLIHELNVQISKNYAESIVEVLVESDNKNISVGDKRNLLIEKSQGEYICFIDDDDFISKNYLKSIIENLGGDILMIRINHLVNGEKAKSIQTSLYIDNLETGDFIFRKNHFHLCPIKREIVNKVRFISVNWAEDLDFSQRIVPYINNYITLDEEIYIYNDNLSKSLTRNV